MTVRQKAEAELLEWAKENPPPIYLAKAKVMEIVRKQADKTVRQLRSHRIWLFSRRRLFISAIKQSNVCK